MFSQLHNNFNKPDLPLIDSTRTYLIVNYDVYPYVVGGMRGCLYIQYYDKILVLNLLEDLNFQHFHSIVPKTI